MTTQRFLLAKYIPDVRRYEPQNMGVILWVRGKTKVKFLDDCQVPFIHDKQTYRRWVAYWTKVAQAESFQPNRGKAVARGDTGFLDALLTTQKDNYSLVDGGDVVDFVSVKDITAATNYLFDELVSTSVEAVQENDEGKTSLYTACKKLFEESGIAKRHDFQTSFHVPYKGQDSGKTLVFHNAIANGVTESLFQRVTLEESQSVQSTAFLFDNQEEVGIKHRAAIIKINEEDAVKPSNRSNIEILKERATVINLEQHRKAIEQLKLMAKKTA